MPELRREPVTETIRLSGLSCADCADKLEQRLKALPGVRAASVQFAAGKLVITHDDTRDTIERTIAAAGYGIAESTTPPLVTSRFRVSGMDCADCAAGLAGRLRHLHGVEHVELNPISALLVVRHRLTPQEIVHQVEAAGYGAQQISGTPGQSIAAFLKTGRHLTATLVAGALLILGLVLESSGAVPAPIYIVVYLAAILTGGYLTLRRGVSALLSRTIDMNVLMSIAIIGACVIRQWHEGALVAVLFAISNLLESFTMERTRESIRGLIALAPLEALVRRDGAEQRILVETLRVGDIVLVPPGEKIAVDGVVTSGSSSVNQASITGESVPVEKGAGDEVFAGTLNELGSLEVRATRLAEDTTLAKIVHLVEEAQTQRAPAQAFVDRFAKVYTPAVLGLAVLVAVLPPLVTGQAFGDWVFRALKLVVLACPCALVISTPVTIVSAIGNAARYGVLIKGGAYLEAAARLVAIAFDKTGTLTRGQPEVTDVITLNGLNRQGLLSLAAAAEQRSGHPLAAAVLRYARMEGVSLPTASDFAALPGRGASARVADRLILVGNPQLFLERGIDLSTAESVVQALQAEGKTAMLVGDDTHLLGVIAAADRVRRESRATVDALHRAGVRDVVMLTGDHGGTAARIAEEVGVDSYIADLLPADKVAAVHALRAREGTVGMVGDGINDAPALASASVGIAMGLAGTATAMETADITLMADELAKLPFLICLSRQALAVIRQNIAIAFAIKAVALILIVPNWLTLWMAVLADMGASLLVTLNGLRLMQVHPEPLAPTNTGACGDGGCCNDGTCHT